MLQQQREVRIWGRSDAPQVRITASWSDQPVRAEVRDGHRKAVIATPAGSFTPQTLTVVDAGHRVPMTYGISAHANDKPAA